MKTTSKLQSKPQSQSQPKPKPSVKQHKNVIIQKIGLCLLVLSWTVLVFYACRILLSFPFRWLLSVTNLSPNFVQMLYSLSLYAATITIIILIPKHFKKSWKTTRSDLGLLGLPTLSDLALAPAGFIIFLILSAVVNFLMSNLSWFNANETQSIGFNFSYGLDRIIALFSLLLVAPIAEEIIFRGYLYGKLKKIIKQPVATAIIISTLVTSLAFAAMHLLVDSTGIHQLNVAINVFCMSLILCLLREISGSIYAGILLHVIKNTLACYILFSTMY
ncbi:CPBP family intramembrane metalloprotease [Candidatus Saccharibacteria bacterium]|nr:CPBP family intramembrane metalloprotease [Candidatus Saccharibacteria bacterium]